MKNSKETVRRTDGSPTRWVLVSSLVIFIVGCIGYFSLPRGPIFYIFAHLGALGLLGLIGCAIGILARKKGYSYWTAFLLGCLLPVVAGLIAVVLFVQIQGHLYCGGAVSLALAILVAIFYALLKKRVKQSPVC